MSSQSQSCCWLLLLLLLGVSAALSSSPSFSGVGVDLSVLVDEEGWSCVQRNLSASSPSEPFAVVRVYRNIGEVSGVTDPQLWALAHLSCVHVFMMCAGGHQCRLFYPLSLFCGVSSLQWLYFPLCGIIALCCVQR